MAGHLIYKDSVINLLVVQSLIKRQLTYKSELLIS